MTLAISSGPLRRRQCFWASRPSLKTMVSVAIREPDPLVRWVRNRTVAKVDSIGLVVRKCDQCWAGKSLSILIPAILMELNVLDNLVFYRCLQKLARSFLQ